MNMLGIYYPGNTFWHRLDPRTKIVFVLAMMITLLASRGIRFGVVCIVTVLLYRLSKLPWTMEWEVVSKFKWLLIIPFLFNLVMPVSSSNWYLTITKNLPGALNVALRFTIILLIATWLSYVTKPMVLVEGMTHLFKPFERFGKQGLDIPLMMGLVIRFVPELFYESENILVTQRIRGIKPGFKIRNSSGWIKSTIIPIFLTSIRKAAALAIAMEARGYLPGIKRSPIIELKLRISDYLIIGLSTALIVWDFFEIWWLN